MLAGLPYWFKGHLAVLVLRWDVLKKYPIKKGTMLTCSEVRVYSSNLITYVGGAESSSLRVFMDYKP